LAAGQQQQHRSHRASYGAGQNLARNDDIMDIIHQLLARVEELERGKEEDQRRNAQLSARIEALGRGREEDRRASVAQAALMNLRLSQAR
jgi:hypothetical protein